MYLIYLNGEFFGHTYSKRLVRLMKKLYPTTKSVHLDEYSSVADRFEISRLTSDEYHIGVHTLKDINDRDVEIISTDYEISEATNWFNQFVTTKLLYSDDELIDLFYAIPTSIRIKLGNYHPIENEVLFSNDGIIYNLTYEGYLLFITRKKGGFDEPSKDICLLSNEDGYG